MIPLSRPFKVKNISLNASDEQENLEAENNINRLINMYTLRFKDIQLESDYRLDKNKKHYYENGHWYKIIFFLLFLYYLFSFVVEYIVQKRWFRKPVIYSMIPTILLEIVLIICIVISFNHRLFIRYINHILYSLVLFMIVQHISNRILVKSISWLHPVLFPIFTFVILRIPFIVSLVLNIIFFLNTLIAINSTNIHIIPLFIGINIFVGFVGYDLEYKSRSNFIMEFSVLNYRRKQSELLNTMLPKIVVSKMINAKLNENGIPIGLEAERHENVSVIFADVYNFQKLIATIEPHRLVELLDSLFLSFDRCSKEFNAIKIETVSETYLTSIGLNTAKGSNTAKNSQNDKPKPSRRSFRRSKENSSLNNANQADGNNEVSTASAAIDMSISMLQVSQAIKINNEETMGVKIGIHTGFVISGLVGSKKPQYALFGDTVNTASRMKTTGELGRIHVSDSTYEQVKNDKTLEFRTRKTKVKGKGLMNTFLLEKALGSNYPDFHNTNTNIYEVDIYYNMMNKSNSQSLSTPRTSNSEDQVKVDMGLSLEGLDDEDINRIKNRRININRAVGNEDDLYENQNLYDYNTFSTSLSSHSITHHPKRKCFKLLPAKTSQITRKYTSKLSTRHRFTIRNKNTARLTLYSHRNTNSIGSSSIVTNLSNTQRDRKRRRRSECTFEVEHKEGNVFTTVKANT